ncbi:hypothetical protein IKF15_03670 [Candidatus Saccharibacteria bacterium]|nr:hypothetical protein [Candidatus Saccharibacteria bacterium]
MFFDARSRIERYLKHNPDTRTILIVGSFGRKSAIRALGMILGQKYTVTMGVNKDVHADIVIFDYKSFGDFPDFVPDLVVVNSCRTAEEAQRFFDVANRAKQVVVNDNDVPRDFLQYSTNPEIITYGDELPAHYYFENQDFSLNGYKGNLVLPEQQRLPVTIKIFGEHNLRPVIMSVAVASLFGLSHQEILSGIEALTPLHGRMSPAKGLRGSIVMDDSAYISVPGIAAGVRTINALESAAKTLVIDDSMPLDGIDMTLLTDVLVLRKNGGVNASPAMQQNPDSQNTKIHYFDDELSLMNYIGERAEPDGIILLEIPLPDIIESYLW